MEWIVYGIWFGCGFLCRQTILSIKMSKLHKQFIKDFEQLMEEEKNGNNKHSK
jgi:hypothetical protein